MDKMGKSLGNFITLAQLFQGTHPHLDQAYSPMTLRHFVLQAHYRSPLNFSTEALKAAYQGYRKLINGLKVFNDLPHPEDRYGNTDQTLVQQVEQQVHQCHEAMNDDCNTPQVMAILFKMLKWIHALQQKKISYEQLGTETLVMLKNTYNTFLGDILGLREEHHTSTKAWIQILLEVYRQAKEKQQYEQVDAIRAQLRTLGIVFQDTPSGIRWCYA